MKEKCESGVTEGRVVGCMEGKKQIWFKNRVAVITRCAECSCANMEYFRCDASEEYAPMPDEITIYGNGVLPNCPLEDYVPE